MIQDEDIELLMIAVAERDRDAFADLYDMTAPKVFALCEQITGDKGLAEDALQDVYMRAWRRIDRYNPEAFTPLTWLLSIARSVAIARAGGTDLAPPAVDGKLATAAPRAASGTSQVAIGATPPIERVVRSLDAKQSEAFRNVLLNGESSQDMAERLSLADDHMKGRIRRSLMLLRDGLIR